MKTFQVRTIGAAVLTLALTALSIAQAGGSRDYGSSKVSTTTTTTTTTVVASGSRDYGN